MMLGYFQQVLNGLVYELDFPDELHAHGLSPFDLVTRAALPTLDSIPAPQRLPRLRELFETHYHPDHPLRVSLGKLQTLDTIRIIEGRE